MINGGLSPKEILRVLVPNGKTYFSFKASNKKLIFDWLDSSNITNFKIFDLKSAKFIWSYDKKISQVCMQANKIYGYSGSHNLICLSLKDGKQLWNANTLSLVGEKPSLRFVSNEMLVFSQASKKSSKIVVLHSKDGG